jgi:hypothetical protein
MVNGHSGGVAIEARAQTALRRDRGPPAPPELSTYSRLVGASRHRAMAGPGSRSLSTEDGPRDVSFLIRTGTIVALAGCESRVSSGIANGELSAGTRNVARALSAAGCLCARRASAANGLPR